MNRTRVLLFSCRAINVIPTVTLTSAKSLGTFFSNTLTVRLYFYVLHIILRTSFFMLLENPKGNINSARVLPLRQLWGWEVYLTDLNLKWCCHWRYPTDRSKIFSLPTFPFMRVYWFFIWCVYSYWSVRDAWLVCVRVLHPIRDFEVNMSCVWLFL